MIVLKKSLGNPPQHIADLFLFWDDEGDSVDRGYDKIVPRLDVHSLPALFGDDDLVFIA